ncbi:MAG: DUF1992 domain-containing protein [Deltaproteobacteria bacterium]|nr:DUF1992 domain-containing protein [Deltaproteobacteria bacterium]
MIAFQKISEHRIMEAQQRGVFDNLPGARPLHNATFSCQARKVKTLTGGIH